MPDRVVLRAIVDANVGDHDLVEIDYLMVETNLDRASVVASVRHLGHSRLYFDIVTDHHDNVLYVNKVTKYARQALARGLPEERI